MTRRVALLVFVLFGVSLLTFTLSNVVPTDPARAALGFDVSPEMVAQYRHEMGLDRPAIVRYARYVGNLTRGDLGVSIMTRRPVLDDLETVVPATIELTLVSLGISVIAGTWLGVAGATRRGSVMDLLSSFVPLTQLSAPVFVFALLLLLVFHRDLGWLPYGGRLASGLSSPAPVTGMYLLDSLLRWDFASFRSAAIHLVLPALTLCNLTLAETARITRSAFLQVMGEDYIRTARSKGLAERWVVWRHGMRNAAVPIITVIGLRLGFLLGGAVVTETIFAWPGMGRYAWEGARNADLNVVMGVTLTVALLYSLVNLAVDIACAYLDPRIRAQ